MINVENFQEDWGKDEEESGDHDDSECVEEFNEMIVEEIDSDDGDGDDESSDGDGMDNYLGESEESEDDDNNDDEEVDDEIGETFIRTFSNGDYDIEFNEALNFDLSAVVPSMPTQASYNKPDNWIDRNRIGLERVKEQLQDCIYSVRIDTSLSLHVTHNLYGHQLMDNEEPIVWHEPILNEHWGRLEAEIDRRKQLDRVADICDIQITNVEMKKERLAALVDIFRNGRVTNSSLYLQFNNTNICGEGIISLSKLVDVSSQLQSFCLHNNRIDSMESARCLSMSMRSHPCINQLFLTHCDLGSSPEILLVVLQSDVKYINLDYTNIDSLGAVKIAEYLGDDPPIQLITLHYNRLNDNDVILISQALKRNTNLRQIDLRSNNVTSIGVKALLSCVFDGSNLNAISESNHTVTEMDLFDDNKSHCSSLLQGCIDRMLKLDRTDKILFALQDKDSLL